MVISVNSSTEPRPEMALSNKEPSISETINSMSDIQLHRYNSTTMDLMERSVRKWAEELSTPEHQVKTYFIRIGLSEMQKSEMQIIFNKIPTSFFLGSETVDFLVKGGRDLLYENPEFKRLISDLNGKIVTEK